MMPDLHHPLARRIQLIRILPPSTRTFLVVLLSIYVGFCAYLYIRQESLIFFPTTITEARRSEVAKELNADIVTIRADDGELLEGWFIADGSEEPRPTILFFAGNADRLDQVMYTLAPLRNHGINLLLVDYRGYGFSTGKPDAKKMKEDAEKIFDAAVSHPFVDRENIIAWGVSLGTGLATHLASKRPIAKVILFAPFTSTEDMARKEYPFVPVSLLLKHKLNNLALAPTLHQPLLIVTGERDDTVPPEHARTLADAWAGPADLLLIPERNHNDLLTDEKVIEKVVEFVRFEAR